MNIIKKGIAVIVITYLSKKQFVVYIFTRYMINLNFFFFCRPLIVPFGLVHSGKQCDAIFYFPISLLWYCHDFVARASVYQQSANGVLTRSWQFVLITVSHVFCAPFLQLMKSEAYLTKRLVNLFLVTGELGTFCHRKEKISKPEPNKK